MLLSNGDNLWGGGRDGEEEETGSSDWVYNAALKRGGDKGSEGWERRDLDKIDDKVTKTEHSESR